MSLFNRTNKKKRSPALLAGIIILSVMIFIMLTLAFLTSYDEVTNVIKGGRLDIRLNETKWAPQNAVNIVPGEVIEKNPSVTNMDSASAYVFLKVTVPYDNLVIENSTNNKGAEVYNQSTGKIPLYKFVVKDSNNQDTFSDTLDSTQSVNSGWKLLSGYPVDNAADKTFTYVYAHVTDDDPNRMLSLLTGATTGKPLFDKIRLVNFNELKFNENRDYSVKVEAVGIQTQYLISSQETTYVPEDVWSKAEN